MIVLVDAHMVGEHETGNETYVVNLILGLQALALPDRFLLATAHPDVLAQSVRLDSQFRAVHVSRSPLRRLLVDLPGIARQEQTDLIHVTYAPPLFAPCPVVVTVHDIAFRRHPEWFSPRDRLVLAAGIGTAMRQNGAILTISDATKSDICAEYGIAADRITVTHLAADAGYSPADDDTDTQALRTLGVTTPYILAVGNLQPRKNLRRLVQAYARLRSQHDITHELVVVGQSQWQTSHLHSTVRELDLANVVRLVDYVDASALRSLYRAADIFAYPSLYEGFGLPILEAMACGTPVLTSKVSSMPEVAGEAALLVDPASVVSIADGLMSLIADAAKREDLVKKGLARAKEFCWQDTARKTYDVYQRIAHTAGKSG